MEARKLLLNPSVTLNRFLPIPQDFIDDGWMSRLKPMTVIVFLFIYRKTVGWHKSSDEISYSQIKRYTGAANDTIGEALKSLEDLGWITRTHATGRSTRITLNFRDNLSQDEVVVSHETVFSADLVEDTSPETGGVPLQFSSTTTPEIGEVGVESVDTSPVFLHPPLQFSSIQYTKEKKEDNNNLLIITEKAEVFSTSESLPIQPSRSEDLAKPEFVIRSMVEDEEEVPKEVFSTLVVNDRTRKFWDKVNLKISRNEPLGTNELLAVFADLYRSNHSGSKYVIQPKHRSKMKILLESLPAQDVLRSVKYYSDHESEYPGGVMSVDVFVGWINAIRSAMDGVAPKGTLESRRDVERKGGVNEW